MKKALIIGPAFFTFNHSISNAFEKFQYSTEIICYDEPIHPFNLKNAILNKTLSDNRKLKEKSRLLFNKYVCNKFDEFSPNIVFIYNGDILNPDTISYFRKTAKVAIWLLDGLYRHPRVEELAPYTDAFFCFEKEDTLLLKSKGINSYFLPQACDTTIYYPLSIPQDIDILFVGTLYGYPKRIEFLKKIITCFKDYNIQIYGIYKPIYKNPIKWIFREHRKIFKNKNVSPQEVNKLYNRSKICINIHHEQSKNGANPKVFEIAGSKSFQIADWNPYLETLFPDDEIVLYHSGDELISLINSYLKKDTAIQTEKAYLNVINNHTFVNRISEVLSIFQCKLT
jgi:spore maturation protein CgeB